MQDLRLPRLRRVVVNEGSPLTRRLAAWRLSAEDVPGLLLEEGA